MATLSTVNAPASPDEFSDRLKLGFLQAIEIRAAAGTPAPVNAAPAQAARIAAAMILSLLPEAGGPRRAAHQAA